jgi:hypothetical protein
LFALFSLKNKNPKGNKRLSRFYALERAAAHLHGMIEELRRKSV